MTSKTYDHTMTCQSKWQSWRSDSQEACCL